MWGLGGGPSSRRLLSFFNKLPPDVENDDAPEANRKPYSISFCTTCMGRLHDLAFTLPQNMADNADYPDLEFLVLDYHSEDGLESWMAEHMRPHIEAGRVT